MTVKFKEEQTGTKKSGQVKQTPKTSQSETSKPFSNRVSGWKKRVKK